MKMAVVEVTVHAGAIVCDWFIDELVECLSAFGSGDCRLDTKPESNHTPSKTGTT